MITTFGDKATARIFQGKFVYPLPLHIQTLVPRKLLMIDAADSIMSLHAPPGNRLEALQGQGSGQWRISASLIIGRPHGHQTLRAGEHRSLGHRYRRHHPRHPSGRDRA
ncbi:type II toxin-antitoxin system RelE/ParE family toxin [Paraburkholderia sp. SG-MS1]|uniref:type II toxin-antitoxin system RelE/ParE family toxin n=1 Tax=Paraburkholderia sp. SG-MS1 TaxID=2023741 RepID=UPI00406BF047